MSFFGGGATTNPTSTPSFGFGASTPAPAPAYTGFGSPPVATTASTSFTGFGSPAASSFPGQTASPGFSFGAPAPTSTTTTQGLNTGTGFGLGGIPGSTNTFTGFGAPTTTTASTSLTGFGATAASSFPGQTASPGFSFGAAAPTSTTNPTSTPSFGFGTSTPAPAFTGFGSAPATTTAPSTLFTGFSSPATTTTSTGFSFGPAAPATTTAQPLNTGFGGAFTGFSAPTASTTAPSTLFTGFSNPAIATTAATGFSFGPSAPVTSTSTTQVLNVGLGGVAGSSINTFGLGVASSGPSGSVSSRMDQRGVKELPLPPELLGLVEDLKNHVKNEKVKMTEVMRASYRTVEQVSGVLDETRAQLLSLSNVIQRQTQNCEIFRQQLSQDIKDAEMAHMTRETPMALQSENYMPMEYFFRLTTDYEGRMVVYRREIKKAEAALAALGSNPSVNAKDLCLSLKSVRDSLVVIAAKVKTLHERVSVEVETHRNLLRFVHGDTVQDVFCEKSKEKFSRWEENADDSFNVFFSNRMKDQTINNYTTSPKESTGGHYYPGAPSFGRASTIALSRHPNYYGGFGSTTLFQSPSSPIFNPHSVSSSPPVSSGISLKRTKH